MNHTTPTFARGWVITPLDGFSVEVEEAKVHYLKSKKAGSMKRAGLQNVSSQQLADLIKNRIADSYIYNMSYDADHDVTKFNVIVEVSPPAQVSEPTRLLAALEYQPTQKALRLITLY